MKHIWFARNVWHSINLFWLIFRQGMSGFQLVICSAAMIGDQVFVTTFLSMRCYASVDASCGLMSVCLCLLLSVTSQCSIKTAGWIEVGFFCMGASFHLYYTVLKGNLDIFKNKGTSLWNFVSDSRLRKVCFGYVDHQNVLSSSLDKGGRSERDDKLDHRWSTKLTIPLCSDTPPL